MSQIFEKLDNLQVPYEVCRGNVSMKASHEVGGYEWYVIIPKVKHSEVKGLGFRENNCHKLVETYTLSESETIYFKQNLKSGFSEVFANEDLKVFAKKNQKTFREILAGKKPIRL